MNLMHEIETERLRLRGFQPGDLEAYQATIYGDADVMRYLPGGQPRPVERTRDVLNFFIEHEQQQGFTVWAVVDKATDGFLGHCGLIYLDNEREVEIAYAFGKAYWGQGFAPEAARACLRYGFEAAGLPHILALAYPANLASQRVMQKIGMQYQGTTDRYYNTELVLYYLSHDAWQPDGSVYGVRDVP
jgi:RimJ/RimL family protein N-acetyltransferase